MTARHIPLLAPTRVFPTSGPAGAAGRDGWGPPDARERSQLPWLAPKETVSSPRLTGWTTAMGVVLLSFAGWLGPDTAAAAPRSTAKPAPPVVDLGAPLQRAQLIRLALQRHPGLAAARLRAAGTRLAGGAEALLPPPEVEIQLWGVPLAKPYDVPNAQMLMFGVKQPIPPPGALRARASAREREADVELSMAAERALSVVRDVEHAIIDYEEAVRKHRVHGHHQGAAQRLLRAAQSRYAAGGALTDVTQAELELAVTEADLVAEDTKLATARARLNGLLQRPPDAPLGAPPETLPSTLGASLTELLRLAKARRPELRTARARTALLRAEAQAAEIEASAPMMAVGALFFAPVGGMGSGYGLSFSSSLPWLWGRARADVRARTSMTRAAEVAEQDEGSKVVVELAAAVGAASAQAARLEVLEGRVVPAAHRAIQAATAGFAAGKTELTTILSAQKALVEAQIEVVDARTTLAHAIVDTEWATGGPVRRKPLRARALDIEGQ